MAVEVVSKDSLLPVLALEFCRLADATVLLVGEGPYLKVYSELRHLLARCEVLPYRRVHGICQAPPNIFKRQDSVLISVFGQKSFRLLTVCHSNDTESHVGLLTDVVELSDWILEVCWLAYSGPDSYKMAALTAHNTVTVHTQRGATGSTQVVHRNEVNCILYSGCLVGSSPNDLVVASGTVFNHVLLWGLQGLPPGDLCGDDVTFRLKTKLTLVGHEGVIFSIRFSDDLTRLVSVSDDRTIRIWDLPPAWGTMVRGVQKTCSLVLYGHTARVWDALLLPECIVSIGEDGTTRIWDHGGRCLEVMEGHGGSSIWSLAVDRERNVMATGGSDCSIQLFQFAPKYDQDAKPGISIPQRSGSGKADLPRSVLLCGGHLLCLTDQGVLYSLRTRDAIGDTLPQWSVLQWDPRFAGYSLMAVSICGGMLALSNLDGIMMVTSMSALSEGRLVSEHLWRAHHGKVFSLTWASASPLSLLLSCGPGGDLICWSVELVGGGTFEVQCFVRLMLPACRHRWISCATVIPVHTSHADHTSHSLGSATPSHVGQAATAHLVVCGDRRGSLHVYKVSACDDDRTKVLGPVSTLCGLHGVNGVTSVVYSGGHILSTGRDGCCRRLAVQPDGHIMEASVFKPVKGVDWIERVIPTPGSDDMLFLVFHTMDLVLHSVKQNRSLLKLSCGGGHRSYGFSSDSELLTEKVVRVTYIKGGMVYFREMNLNEALYKPVLQQPFVGKEAISMEVIDDTADGSGLIAVGSEECTVCLLQVQVPSSGHCVSISCLQSLQGHLSSVRALASTPSGLHSNHKLLFSGGGRASVKTWLICVDDHSCPNPVLQSDLFLHEPQSSSGPQAHHHHSRWRRRRRGVAFKADPECRVMSLTTFPLAGAFSPCHGDLLRGKHYLAVACSDGIIRQYIYCEKDCDFTALSHLSFHNRCLLKVSHIVHRDPAWCASSQTTASDHISDSMVLLCSTATDGMLAFWSLNHCLDFWLQSTLMKSSEDEMGSNWEENRGTGSGLMEQEMGSNWEENRGTGSGLLEQCSAEPKVVLAVKVHQSGVNDVAITPSPAGGSCYRVATVGDDNCLSVLECCLSLQDGGCGSPELLPSVHVTFQCSEPNAHSSSITGVQFLSPTAVLTTSVDQRLNVWEIADMSLVLVWGTVHDVADTAAMKVLRTAQRGKVLVLLCGIGFQCFCMQVAMDTAT